MNRFSVFLIILLAFIQQGFSQIAFEDFNDSQLPQDWTSVINSGTCEWNTFTNNTPRGLDFSSTALLYLGENCGEEQTNNNVSIVTSSYDVSNVSALLLSVEIGLNSRTSVSGEELSIEVYDGNAWVTIKNFTGNWNPYTFIADVSAYRNDAFSVRFTYDNNGVRGIYAGIDNFELSEEAFPELPAQVNCASAEEVSAGTHTVNPIQPGYAPETCSTGNNARGGAWFTYTASLDGIATVSSVLSQNDQIDTSVSILTGDCSTTSCYVENDDSDLFFSTVSFEVSEGSTYFIVFDDRNDNSGFDFSLVEEEENCNAGNGIAVDFSDRTLFEECHTVLDGTENDSWVEDAADFKLDGNIVYFATNYAEDDQQKDDYLFSPKLILEEGETYPISFTYNGRSSDFQEANESLQVLVASTIDPNSEMTLIYEATNIRQEGSDATIFDNAIQVTNRQFTPEVGGEYYLVFRTTSQAPSGELLLFSYTFGETNLSIPSTNNQANFDHFYNASNQILNLKATSNLQEIKVFSMSGQQVFKSKLKTNSAKVNLNNLPKGVYIVHVETSHQEQRFKLLKS